jgi:thymidine kinase
MERKIATQDLRRKFERKVVTPNLENVNELVLVTGSMFSGKSKLLMDIIESFELNEGRVAKFKPKLDKRDLGVIKSRDYERVYNAWLVGEGGQVPSLPRGYLDTCTAVVVDEAQFLDINSIKWLIGIGKGYNIPVIFGGLDKDFKGDTFEAIEFIRSYEPYEINRKATCFICGEKTATLSRRVVNNKVMLHGEQVLVGDSETYIAVCTKCDKTLVKEY